MMSIKSPSVVLAVTALLAGCGGGADTAGPVETAQAVSTDAAASAVNALRARIQAARPVALAASAATSATPTEAAEQLMDYGETHFKELFPEHQPSQVSGPFRYRAYSTGIYLGVVVNNADPAYALGGVYVMGKQFGVLPLYVAPLTNFITPVPGPDTDPNGLGNGCYDLGLLDNEGTRSVIAYQIRGPVTGDVTLDTVTGANTTFEGQTARVITTKTSGSTTSSGQTITLDTESKAYQRRTAQSEITNYGSEITTRTVAGGLNSTSVKKTVFTPAWADRQYALAEGQSTTNTQNEASTTTTTVTGLPPSTSSSNSTTNQTVKYAGRETLAVPAGTYNTCKFEITSTSVAGMTTQWVIVNKGLMVKSVTTSGPTTQTIEAASVTLNGQKL